MSLFNKYNFKIKDFTADSTTRPELNGIFINGKESVATDSFIMIRVDSVRKGLSIDDYPVHPDGRKILKDFNAFILPKETAIDVLGLFKKDNSNLPIINNAVIMKSGKGQVEIGKSDLESFNSVNSKTTEGEYPKYLPLFEQQRQQKCVKIQVNARLLKKIITFYTDFCDDGNKTLEISVPTSPDKPLGFVATRKDTGQTARTLLMPIKIDGPDVGGRN